MSKTRAFLKGSSNPNLAFLKFLPFRTNLELRPCFQVSLEMAIITLVVGESQRQLTVSAFECFIAKDTLFGLLVFLLADNAFILKPAQLL
jgi:hypothetical protein